MKKLSKILTYLFAFIGLVVTLGLLFLTVVFWNFHMC